MLKRRIVALLPLIVVVILGLFLWRGLDLKPNKLPSPLINKAAPAFELTSLFDPQKKITEKYLLGKVTLVNVWASWCLACSAEHDFLMQLSQDENLQIIGWDYKDDRLKALDYLKQKGNPYRLVLFDPKGKAALDWGVYGTPETFIVDKKGIIRYKQVGQLNEVADQAGMMALIGRLEHE